jgi:hypothetical protein
VYAKARSAGIEARRRTLAHSMLATMPVPKEEASMTIFYFHTTATYAILRHCGVELGKSDFIGALD